MHGKWGNTGNDLPLFWPGQGADKGFKGAECSSAAAMVVMT